jgi:hypothetical protein
MGVPPLPWFPCARLSLEKEEESVANLGNLLS